MPQTSFGTLLKEIRERRGLSQKALAEHAGLSHVAVGDWERGKRNPRKDNIHAVAQVLGVDAGELLAAAGFTDKEKVVRITDPDVLLVVEAYEGASRANKQLLRAMAEQINKIERENTIGLPADDDESATAE